MELVSRTSLPNESRSLLPPTHLTIAALCSTPLPSPTTTLFFKNAQAAFSMTPPNTSLSYLLSPKHACPSQSFLRDLRDAAGQAMLDGCISIEYWGAPDVYLPFEALGFWYELGNAIRAQEAWNSAQRWLGNTRLRDNASRTARINSIIQSLPWAGLISKLGRSASVSHMADFLSTARLSSSHIDAMLLCIRARYRDEVGYQPGNQITLFPTLSFTELLRSLKAKGVHSIDNIMNHPDLSTIGNFAANSQRDILIATVAYWPPNHWGSLFITISGGRVQAKWGDGLQRKIPSLLSKGIRAWSNRYLPRHFITVDSGFPCATQQDGYSCGFIALNMIKHHVLGCPSWTRATREDCRVDEFLSCMEFCMDDRVSHSI